MEQVSKAARFTAIDMLRGLVIALMALDHVRDYFGAAPFNPEDLSGTTPAWFWTRWVTHLCATTFVLLAGTSAALRGRGRDLGELSRYLASRGALLILLEMTWISFSWQFGYGVIILQVLWALGAGMIFLALLVWLPRAAIAAVAALLTLPHNLFDNVKTGGVVWRAWHQGGFTPLGEQFGIVFMYPLMPWLGLIAAGYAIGPVFDWDAVKRRRFLLGAGTLLLVAFVALRWANLYGDPQPWSPQGKGWMFDLMSFMRVAKYPPSLLYICSTLGISLFLLAWLERVREIKLLTLFGRHPLFFYCVHVALIHFLGILYMRLRFGGLIDFSTGSFKGPDGYTPDLLVVYLAWPAMLLLMYGLTVQWQRWRLVRR
jgi:uncharacterized membrane protein